MFVPVGASAADNTLYDLYRRSVAGDRLTLHVRVGSVVVLAINTAFIALDYYAFRERFELFLLTRAVLNVFLLYTILSLSRRLPHLAETAVCLATGAMLLTVVYGTGGATSEYYVGLILLFVGMPVLLPLTALEAAGICSVLFVGFIVSPLFATEPLVWKSFVVNAVFLGSAAFESAVSCALLDRIRFNDFCQRREIEAARDQLRELDEAKSRFSANIHHELRTPLTLMLAPLDSMLSGQFGEVSETQRSYLETMHKNALRLLKLINNLLDHARIESGLMEVHRQPLDLPRVVGDIVESARPLAERKRVELVAELAADLPTVNADPDALEKVLVNLVGNALKFTDPGGRITVSAQPAEGPAAGRDGKRRDAGGARVPGVELVVADTGAGIPPDQLERVFDRFAQVDSSATRRHEGTGIGLSLVRELVALHGGCAWATSEGIGRGAQFHVFLPIGSVDAGAEEVLHTDDGKTVKLRRSFDALAADLDHHGIEGEAPVEDRHAARYKTAELERTVERFESAAGAPPAPVAAAVDHRPEIVVAEDNADMRRLLVHLLGTEFAVRPARNGREALELVRERVPMLIVTDVMMPEMSGTELCEAIKGDPELAGVPVMLVTSKAEREMKIQGLERGADDYVTKPFHPRELVARARSLVRLRELQMELAEQNAALDRALQHLRDTEVQLIQAERLAAVGELAAGVAHEVNNPVNFALNSLRVLQDTVGQVREFASRLAAIDWRDAAKLPERAKELQRLEAEIGLEEVVATLDELISIVIEGLERTGRLVADLRDFGAPGDRSGQPLDVAQALESTLAMAGATFARGGVRLEREIEPELPVLEGDPGAIKQLFLNLLKNAVEALEETGGTVRVTAARSQDGRAVEVSVSDDGPGIEPAEAERIFEPFFTTKPAGRGTGLGLSICRRIAEAHGGTLTVSSTPGAGATFTLRLPAEAPHETAPRT